MASRENPFLQWTYVTLTCKMNKNHVHKDHIDQHMCFDHDWEGNIGEYSVRGWQYWPDRREGQYIT